MSQSLAVTELSVSGGRWIRLAGTPGEYIFEQIQTSGQFYEVDLLDAIAHIDIPPGGVAVDVGANIGNHTLYLASNLDLRVVAVEPEVGNVSLLRHNVELNGLQDKVVVVAAAAWSSRERLRLVNEVAGNGGTFHGAVEADGEVQAAPLDELVVDGPVRLIKIDVEGAEPHVLAGARGILERDRPVVVTECHGAEAYRKIADHLRPLGYEPVVMRGRSDNFVWMAPDPAATKDIEYYTRLFALEGARRAERRLVGGTDRNGRELTKISTTVAEMTTGLHAMHENAVIGVARSEELADGIGRSMAALEAEVSSSREDLSTVLEELRTSSAMLRGVMARSAHEKRVLEGDIETWAAAYRDLSRRLAALSPATWSHERAGEVLRATTSHVPAGLTAQEWQPERSQPPHMPAPRTVARDPIRIGIASMPGRTAGLLRVLRSLAPQADDVHVYLNQHTEVPSELVEGAASNVHFHLGDDLGDRAKFLFVRGFEGYYLTCDDDIAYPDFYVDHVIDGVERHGRRALVGWHGSVFLDGFDDFYDPKSRRVFAYYSTRPADTPVHLLGTGAAGFHTDTITTSFDDYKLPNMADVWLALKAQRLGLPMIVLKHERGWAEPIDRDAPSISNASIRRAPGALEVRKTVTELVQNQGVWEINHADPVVERDPLSVAIIGRTDIVRWKKGGILRSCHLTASALRRYGAEVSLHDIETGDPRGLGGARPDVVMIYVGDPDRPDFARVVDLVAHHAELGRMVVINLSVQGRPERARRIADVMRAWRVQFSGRVHLMVFTTAARDLPEFAGLRDSIIEIPKTLTYAPPAARAFGATEGIFLGDVAKLTDTTLTEQPAEDWIAAIRRSVPEARLYAVRQYAPKAPRDLDIDEIWPFTHEGLDAKLSRIRVMVAPVKYATFEMVPVEAAALGLPVLYRRMPQSLSEYLGLAGVEVDSPDELAGVLRAVYRDPSVWSGLSRAGSERVRSASLTAGAAQMYLRLAALQRRGGGA